LAVRLLLVLLEQPDAVVVRGYGRVVPRPNGGRFDTADPRAAAVVRRRPLPLVLLIVDLILLLLLLLLMMLVMVIVRWSFDLGRGRRSRDVVRHCPPAGHRAGPIPGAPRFRERAERHVRGPGARVRRHAGLGARAALVSYHHSVHGLQVSVTGPAPLFVVRRRQRGRGRGRRQLQRRWRRGQRHRGRRVVAAVGVHAARRFAVAAARGLRRVAGRGRLGLRLDRVLLLEIVGGRHRRALRPALELQARRRRRFAVDAAAVRVFTQLLLLLRHLQRKKKPLCRINTNEYLYLFIFYLNLNI